MFTIKRRRRRKEEKDELLAHMQTSKSARALCVNVTVKKAIIARSEERKGAIFSFCLYMYIYICIYVQ